jgi:hypothetical protein
MCKGLKFINISSYTIKTIETKKPTSQTVYNQTTMIAKKKNYHKYLTICFFSITIKNPLEEDVDQPIYNSFE